jgi:predicted RNA-binding Zn ribbon-like protein
VFGNLPKPSDVSVINRSAAMTPLAPVASSDASAAHWSGTAVSGAMSLVARDAILVCTTMPRERLRICADPSCTGLFLDESRPGKRRWCSMLLCGDRQKKERFRSKPRETTAHQQPVSIRLRLP